VVAAFETLMTGFGLGADQTLALGRYLDLLLDWRRANVTAVRTRDEAADRLVGDSLALLDVPELETAGRRWLDLGAGAGIPGIPLALARPDVRLTLLDAVGKKCAFLEAAVEVTGLETRAEVVCARSEALASRAGGPAAPAAASGGGRSTTTVTEPTAGGSSGARGDRRRDRDREAFDVVLVRAVGALATVVEFAAPLLAPGGSLVAVKTAAGAAKEGAAGDAAAALCGLSAGAVRPLCRSPLADSVCVVYAKVAPAPQWLPRRVGLAARRPLAS